jgi:hypothetical protein
MSRQKQYEMLLWVMLIVFIASTVNHELIKLFLLLPLLLPLAAYWSYILLLFALGLLTLIAELKRGEA